METFRTVKKDSHVKEAYYEIQKSKFYARICHAETEDEVRAFILEIKKRCYDARHNPSAYILGTEPSTMKMKSNDDGEPGGTSGNPILEAMKKRGITNACLVVTRYFGGIKLGAGGLIRAYGHAAGLAIAAASIVEMRPFTALAVKIPYELLASIEHFIREESIHTEETIYAEDVTLHLLLPPGEIEEKRAVIIDRTAGKAVLTEGDTRCIAIEITSCRKEELNVL